MAEKVTVATPENATMREQARWIAEDLIERGGKSFQWDQTIDYRTPATQTRRRATVQASALTRSSIAIMPIASTKNGVFFSRTELETNLSDVIRRIRLSLMRAAS